MKKRLLFKIKARYDMNAKWICAFTMLIVLLSSCSHTTAFNHSNEAPEPGRHGGLVVLPAEGTLFVASDFHARWRDFERWLHVIGIEKSLDNGENVYAVLCGDIVDGKPGDDEAEREGDSKILAKIREIQTKSDFHGQHLILLRGNHEQTNLKICQRIIEEYGKAPWEDRALYRNLCDGEKGRYYQQFNFLERMTADDHDYLTALPLVVMTRSGIVCVHGGPAASLTSPQDIVAMNEKVVEELLWSRPRPVDDEGYRKKDLKRFLSAMNGSSLLISGHTPLEYLPSGWLKNNVGLVFEMQIILGTSYGHEPAEKCFLKIDLSLDHPKPASLTQGKEIRLLNSETTRLVRPDSSVQEGSTDSHHEIQSFSESTVSLPNAA